MIFNLIGGGANSAAKSFPEFTYTGNYELIDDGKDGSTQNWRIKFLTSGTLKFTKVVSNIDLFMVGGGGSGGKHTSTDLNSGGGGGYTNTYKQLSVEENVEYQIIVGAGGSTTASGSNGNRGGTSSAFGHNTEGGYGGMQWNQGGGGAGGSGGGAGGGKNGTGNVAAGAGGRNGSNGGSSAHWAGGQGQGRTTKEFGEETGTMYAGGGAGVGTDWPAGGEGGGGSGGSAGVTNSGGGGGGAGEAGGSGIVVIRNPRAA